MYPTIHSQQQYILVLLETREKMIRLSILEDETASSYFQKYFSRWMSIFDGPVYTVVDRRTNIAAKYIPEQLRSFQTELCTIPTEAP